MGEMLEEMEALALMGNIITNKFINQSKMKKVILTLGIAFASYNAGAQIVIKETLKDSVVWYNKLVGLPKLICFYNEEETSYTLYFQNAKYTHIRDVQYLTLGDLATAKEFFNLLLKVADGSGEEITIELDKATWIISKSMGSISIWSSYESFYLTRKNVETILETL
jgi:hypothetical protein